jgi:hypothetical protein
MGASSTPSYYTYSNSIKDRTRAPPERNKEGAPLHGVCDSVSGACDMMRRFRAGCKVSAAGCSGCSAESRVHKQRRAATC